MRKLATGLIIALLVALVVIFFIWPEEEPIPEPPRIAEPTTSRLTTEGEYVGFMDANGARAWLGIPFAAAPVGDLRWAAPTPPERHEGVKEALHFGSMCVQMPNATLRSDFNSGEGIVGSEDCLYLNIWSPPNAIDAPVMFWIHGGGNSVGEAATYNGSALASKHKVVVVTTNYRLSVFGWFNEPNVLEAGEQSSGNFSTLDLIRSLEWVQDNIRSFGGDPSNVTIFGESAGGFNVLTLLVAKPAEGLFHRAISQSGGFERTESSVGYKLASEGGHSNSASELTNRMLIADGLADDATTATSIQTQWTAAESNDYLKSKSAAEIYATLEGGGFGMVDFPRNFADDVVIPTRPAVVATPLLASTETEATSDEPTRSAESKSDEFGILDLFGDRTRFHNVPVILGTNRDEPTLFMLQNPDYVDTFLGIFPRLKDENDYKRIVYYGAQAWKVRGVDSIATAMRNAGHEAVYAYRFDWDEEPSTFGFDLSVALGAGHAMEIPFVFGSFNNLGMLSGFMPNDEAQFALSDTMTSYWAEFAYNGSPAKGRDGNEVEWTSFDPNGPTTIILDTAADGGVRMMNELVTYESLRDELIADNSFNDKDTHCRTFVTTIGDESVFRQEDFEQAGCGHIDRAEVSWY